MMQISIASPVQASPWSPEIPCEPTRTDATTKEQKNIGFCLVANQQKIACWMTEGWIEEHFVEPPANRIKGWLELIETLLRRAADPGSDDQCAKVRFLRAAADATEVIDRITSEGATWDAPMASLYDATKTKIRELSTRLETSARAPGGQFEAHLILRNEAPLLVALADSAKLGHTAMKRDNGSKVEKIDTVEIALVMAAALAVAAGVAAAITGTVGTALAAAVVAAAAIYAIVRIFEGIISVLDGLF